MKTYVLKTWLLAMMFAFASVTQAQELWIRDFSAHFNDLVLNLAANQCVTSQEVNKYENGECQIYHFSAPMNVFNNKVYPFYRFLHQASVKCTQYILCDDMNVNAGTNEIRYGKTGEKSVSFPIKQSEHYALHALQEYNENSRKHFFAVDWQKKGDKMVGTAYFILRIERDFSKSVKGAPENSDDFLMMLGNYRAAFLKLEKRLSEDSRLAAQTAIVNQIVQLCDKHAKLLKKDEKNLGRLTIIQMRENVSDSFLKGMLLLAAKKLK